jgi:hypothetical protein
LTNSADGRENGIKVAMTLAPLTHDAVRFRFLRSDDRPATNPDHLAYVFGLQDTQQNLTQAQIRPDGTLVFDFSLKVKPGKDPALPVFTGPFASGSPADRFVYLSWRAIERGDYINRAKIPLAGIDWKLIHASLEQNRPITADVSGRGPGNTKKPITWYLE